MENKFINFPMGVDTLMNKIDEDLRSNGKKNDEKYAEYYTALTKLKMLEKEGKIELAFDQPDNPLKFHSITVKFIEDSFDTQSEIKELTSSLEKFDGLMLNADNKGNISFVLIKDNIYT